tara:strand:- start:44 stop:436 length:393 start_codon:yes stop_codon:yes gene_type:complete
MFKIKRTEENAKIPKKKEHFWNKYSNAEITERDNNENDNRTDGTNVDDRSIAKNMWLDLNAKDKIDENLKELFGEEWSIDIIWQKIQVVFWIVGAYFSVRFIWYILAFLSKKIQLAGPKNLLKTSSPSDE